ncbi:nesprin-1-like isoform X2 [Centruroides vittatus]|uniref:nesprin-1-like isoform X2 n=1 Tax=Centruroides vittatus TaxID=120091 RepID=UPI00350EE252
MFQSEKTTNDPLYVSAESIPVASTSNEKEHKGSGEIDFKLPKVCTKIKKCKQKKLKKILASPLTKRSILLQSPANLSLTSATGDTVIHISEYRSHSALFSDGCASPSGTSDSGLSSLTKEGCLSIPPSPDLSEKEKISHFISNIKLSDLPRFNLLETLVIKSDLSTSKLPMHAYLENYEHSDSQIETDEDNFQESSPIQLPLSENKQDKIEITDEQVHYLPLNCPENQNPNIKTDDFNINQTDGVQDTATSNADENSHTIVTHLFHSTTNNDELFENVIDKEQILQNVCKDVSESSKKSTDSDSSKNQKLQNEEKEMKTISASQITSSQEIQDIPAEVELESSPLSQITDYQIGEESTQVSRTVTSQKVIRTVLKRTTCTEFAGQTSQVIQIEDNSKPTVVLSSSQTGKFEKQLSSVSQQSVTLSNPQFDNEQIRTVAQNVVSQIIQKSQQIINNNENIPEKAAFVQQVSHKTTEAGMISKKQHSVKRTTFSSRTENVADYHSAYREQKSFTAVNNVTVLKSTGNTATVYSSNEGVLDSSSLYEETELEPCDDNPLQTCEIQEIIDYDDDDEEDEEIKRLTGECDYTVFEEVEKLDDDKDSKPTYFIEEEQNIFMPLVENEKLESAFEQSVPETMKTELVERTKYLDDDEKYDDETITYVNLNNNVINSENKEFSEDITHHEFIDKNDLSEIEIIEEVSHKTDASNVEHFVQISEKLELHMDESKSVKINVFQKDSEITENISQDKNIEVNKSVTSKDKTEEILDYNCNVPLSDDKNKLEKNKEPNSVIEDDNNNNNESLILKYDQSIENLMVLGRGIYANDLIREDSVISVDNDTEKLKEETVEVTFQDEELHTVDKSKLQKLNEDSIQFRDENQNINLYLEKDVDTRNKLEVIPNQMEELEVNKNKYKIYTSTELESEKHVLISQDNEKIEEVTILQHDDDDDNDNDDDELKHKVEMPKQLDIQQIVYSNLNDENGNIEFIQKMEKAEQLEQYGNVEESKQLLGNIGKLNNTNTSTVEIEECTRTENISEDTIHVSEYKEDESHLRTQEIYEESKETPQHEIGTIQYFEKEQKSDQEKFDKTVNDSKFPEVLKEISEQENVELLESPQMEEEKNFLREEQYVLPVSEYTTEKDKTLSEFIKSKSSSQIPEDISDEVKDKFETHTLSEVDSEKQEMKSIELLPEWKKEQDHIQKSFEVIAKTSQFEEKRSKLQVPSNDECHRTQVTPSEIVESNQKITQDEDKLNQISILDITKDLKKDDESKEELLEISEYSKKSVQELQMPMEVENKEMQSSENEVCDLKEDEDDVIKEALHGISKCSEESVQELQIPTYVENKEMQSSEKSENECRESYTQEEMKEISDEFTAIEQEFKNVATEHVNLNFNLISRIDSELQVVENKLQNVMKSINEHVTTENIISEIKQLMKDVKQLESSVKNLQEETLDEQLYDILNEVQNKIEAMKMDLLAREDAAKNQLKVAEETRQKAMHCITFLKTTYSWLTSVYSNLTSCTIEFVTKQKQEEKLKEMKILKSQLLERKAQTEETAAFCPKLEKYEDTVSLAQDMKEQIKMIEDVLGMENNLIDKKIEKLEDLISKFDEQIPVVTELEESIIIQEDLLDSLQSAASSNQEEAYSSEFESMMISKQVELCSSFICYNDIRYKTNKETTENIDKNITAQIPEVLSLQLTFEEQNILSNIERRMQIFKNILAADNRESSLHIFIINFVIIIETIAKYFEIINRYLNRTLTNSEEHLQEYKIIENNLSQIEQHIIFLMSAMEMNLIEEDTKGKMIQCLTLIQEHYLCIRSALKNKIQMMEEEINAIKSVGDELEHFQLEIDHNKEKIHCDSLPNEKFIVLKETENTICNQKEKLLNIERNFQQLPLQTVCNYAPQFYQLSESLQNLQIQVCEDVNIIDRQLSMEKSYLQIANQLMNFLEFGKSWLHLELTISDIDEMNQYLNEYKIFFQNFHYLLALLKDMYCHLSDSFQVHQKNRHNELLNEASEMLTRAIDKGQQLEQCVLKWNELLYLLNVSSEWLNDQKDSLKMEKTKHKGKLEEYILFFKSIQSDIQNHLPQIKLIEKLISSIRKMIKNHTLEDEVHNLLTNWKSFIKDVDEEFSLISNFESQWKAFENDLKELEIWITNSEKLIPQFDEIKNFENDTAALINCIKDIVKIQTEQENKESFWQQIRQSLQMAITLEIYETEYGQLLTKQLDDSWSQLSEALLLARSTAYKYLLQLPGFELVSNLWTWIEEIQKILEEEVDDITSFSDSEMLLMKYQRLKSELQVKHDIIKSLNLDQKKKQSLQSQKFASGKSLSTLTIRWQEVSSEVSAQIKLLEMLITKWTEFNQISNTFNKCLQKHKTMINHIEQLRYKQKEDAINDSLNQLELIERSAEERTIELEEIKKIGQAIQEMKKYNFIQSHISYSIKANERLLSEFNSDLMRIKLLLKEKQNKWERYHFYLESINNFQKKMEYILMQCKIPVFHPKICSTRIDELRFVLAAINENHQNLKEFENITIDVIKDVDVTIQLELNAVLEGTQKSWNLLTNSCNALSQQYVQLQPRLASLVLQSEILKNWITDTKKHILQLKNDPNSVESYQNIAEEINTKQNEASDLEKVEKDLSEIEIFDRSAFKIHYFNNNKKLLQDCSDTLRYCLNNSKHVATEMNEYQAQISQVSSFLEVVEEKLSREWDVYDEDKIEEIINDLKFHMNQIPQHEVSIFTLSEKLVQNNLSRSETCQDVLNVLLRWKRFRVNIVKKYSLIQNQWLQKQDFIRKCHSLLLFLHELRSHLRNEIPSSYENVLKEYCNMQVLDIITSAQQGVLLSFMQEGLELSSRMSEENAEKFLEQLYKLQEQWFFINDILTKKKNTILYIISLWQNYMRKLYEIQSRLNETELQSLKFKKNCLFTIEEVKNGIIYINSMLEQKSHWENSFQELHSSYLILIPHINSESVEIIHKEKINIRERMDELWNLFSAQKVQLNNLDAEWNKFQAKMTDVKQLLEQIENLLEEKIPSLYDDLLYQLQQLKIYKKKLQDSESSVEELENTIVVLNEKFSSSEILQIRNNVITFRENLKTIYYKLINRINIIDKSLQEWPKFHTNCANLLEWILNLEKVLSQRGDYCLDDACQKLEKTHYLEIEQKTQEYDDLVKFGERLIAAGGEKEFLVQEDLEEVQIAWKKLIMFRTRRLDKLISLLEESKQLQQKMFEFNEWLEGKEHQLFAPVIYENFTYSEITKQIEKMEEYEEEIENQYRVLRTIMSMCEMLMHDNDAIVNPVERDAIQRSIESYKRRWKELGTVPAEHKSRIEETWNQWKKIMIDLDEIELLLSDYKKQIEMPKTCATIYTRDEICEELKKYELLYQSVHSIFELLENINKQYEELEQEGCLDKANTLSNRVNSVNSCWSELNKRINIIICRLSYTLQLWEEFQASHEKLLMWLTELDLILTETEYFPEKQDSLQNHLKEVEDYKEEKNSLYQLSVYLQQRSEPSDSTRAEELVQNVQQYWDQLFSRLSILQQKANEIDDTNDKDRDLSKEMIDSNEIKTEVSVNENRILNLPIPTIITESAETYESSDVKSLENPIVNLELHQEIEKEEISVLDELKIALKETEEKLGITEEAIRSQTPIGFETEIVSHNYSRLLATCRCSIDILKHFNSLLQCEEEGLSQATTSHYNHAQGIISRWEILEAKTIEKDRRLQQARHQWQQYIDDLTAVEDWLDTAEKRQAGWILFQKDMSKLELMIQNHREFLMEMIKYKPTILSLNMLTQKFLTSSTNEIKSEELQTRLKVLNKRWENLCQSAMIWQNELQKALLQCPDFQNTLQELVSWLEMSEERIHQMGTLRNMADHNIISIQYNKYLELKQELERCKPKIKAFEQTASNLTIPSSIASSLGKEVETVEIQMQLNKVNDCLQSLIDKCDAEIRRLNVFLQSKEEENAVVGHFGRSKDTSEDNKTLRESEVERSRLNRCYRYLSRVARASLPIQGLMLLLLGIASLVPMSENDFSCVLTNNFARSFDPMLKYPDGPPPI